MKKWKLRLAPLTTDKTNALLEPGFDKDEVNSQYQILEGAKSTNTEDTHNIVGKVHSNPSLDAAKVTTKCLPHLTNRVDC